MPACLSANPTIPVSLCIFPYFFPSFMYACVLCCAMLCCAVHEYILASFGMDEWILVCGHTSVSVCPQTLFSLIH